MLQGDWGKGRGRHCRLGGCGKKSEEEAEQGPRVQCGTAFPCAGVRRDLPIREKRAHSRIVAAFAGLPSEQGRQG